MNSKPNYVRLEEIRHELCRLRGEIAEIRREDKLWENWLSPCEGGITCILIAAHIMDMITTIINYNQIKTIHYCTILTLGGPAPIRGQATEKNS